MKRIAAPMQGGVGSALLAVLIVFPAVYSFWRGEGSMKPGNEPPAGRPPSG